MCFFILYSAGVGRSGTFIVIDCMLARIQNEQTIDIYNYVRYLRTRRMYMVQTEVNPKIIYITYIISFIIIHIFYEHDIDDVWSLSTRI